MFFVRKMGVPPSGNTWRLTTFTFGGYAKMKIKLVVYLSDGRTLIGVYDYIAVLERLQFARTMPNFQGFDLVEAV